MDGEYLRTLSRQAVDWIRYAFTSYFTAMKEVLDNTLTSLNIPDGFSYVSNGFVIPSKLFGFNVTTRFLHFLHLAATAVFGIFGLAVAFCVLYQLVNCLRWICCGRRRRTSEFRIDSERRGNDVTAVKNGGMDSILESSRWLRQARNDLMSARNDLDGVSPAPEWVCYKCYQSMEKLLKAVLIARNIPVDVGRCDLIHLSSLINDNQLRNISRRIQETVGSTSRMNSLDSLPSPGVPRDVYSQAIAIRVYESTERALEHICCLLDISF